jgi:pyruvate,water dikinase
MNASQPENVELVLPLDDIGRVALPIAGGKAANLGELIRAGLPVPPGFCVTTAAYELVAEGADLDHILADLAETSPPSSASPRPPNVSQRGSGSR